MAARGAAQILRERIGIEATDALSTMMNESTRSMAEEIVRAMGDRFERRLSEESAGVNRRLSEESAGVNRRLTEEISGLRVEMHKGFGELRAEIANAKTDVIRWAFLFWIGQAAAFGGFLTYLK